jgi:O-methyltransferase
MGDYVYVEGSTRSIGGLLKIALRKVLAIRGLDVAKPLDPVNWVGIPRNAETMIGLVGLDNLQHCITDVLNKRIPGDLIETGAWRGGATIFMRAVLYVYGDTTRKVWVADSFRGVPRPNPQKYPADKGDRLWASRYLAVSLDEVKRNFSRYGMLDDQVEFLVGWFGDTLPLASIERLAVLRLDGDLYESTMDSLRCLYPKLSIGGYVIVDDYGAFPGCRLATDDFRKEHGIVDKLTQFASHGGVVWRRTQ